MDVLGMGLPYIKRYFRSTSEVLFFMAQGTQIIVVFENAGFGEIKDHSLSTIDFLKVSLP